MKKAKVKKPEIAGAVSILTHQLRTPLSVIKGFLESLVSGDCGKINPMQEEYLEDALENVNRMKATINDFLLTQKVEEGKYELKIKPISLEEIVFKVLSDMALWAKALNCEIFFKKPEELPRVLGDAQSVRDVVENLVSNAIKYSRGRGKVKISVNLVAKDKKTVFTCKDNGVGIARKDFNKVFTKFYRSEKAVELDPSGSGLGLYINKIFIEASGGKVWFLKNKGPGMTFYFSLPVA